MFSTSSAVCHGIHHLHLVFLQCLPYLRLKSKYQSSRRFIDDRLGIHDLGWARTANQQRHFVFLQCLPPLRLESKYRTICRLIDARFSSHHIRNACLISDTCPSAMSFSTSLGTPYKYTQPPGLGLEKTQK